MSIQNKPWKFGFRKVWIYLLLTWGQCSSWLIVGWSQVSNESQATRSSLDFNSKSFILKHISKSSGGTRLSGLSPGQSGHPWIVRTWTRIVRTKFSQGIYTAWGTGFYRFLFFFTLTPPLTAQIRPRGVFHLLSIIFSQNLEGRITSTPETPKNRWVWSSRVFLKVSRYFEFLSSRSQNVEGFLGFPLGHCLLASLGTCRFNFIQIPWRNL